jgi:hypothetical protein
MFRRGDRRRSQEPTQMIDQRRAAVTSTPSVEVRPTGQQETMSAPRRTWQRTRRYERREPHVRPARLRHCRGERDDRAAEPSVLLARLITIARRDKSDVSTNPVSKMDDVWLAERRPAIGRGCRARR